MMASNETNEFGVKSDNETDELVFIQLLEFKTFVMDHVGHTSPLRLSAKMGRQSWKTFIGGLIEVTWLVLPLAESAQLHCRILRNSFQFINKS